MNTLDEKDKQVQPIVDLHTCIQGEGQLAGVPHILIRLAGCNLRCAFKGSLCDTPYSSWQAEKGKYTFEDVQRFIRAHRRIAYVMITGGEPTIHPDLLINLCLISKMEGKFVTIETNGTKSYKESLRGRVTANLVSISPKLKSSTPISAPGKWGERHEALRENIPAIVSWIKNSKHIQLKYVVSSEDDIKEVKEQLSKIVSRLGEDDLEKLSTYLMPEGDTEEKLQMKRQWLAERCIEEGFRYTDRLHIIIFGSKREA